MSYRSFFERDLIRETSVSRRVHLRVDSQGIYLLFFQGEDLKAGNVFQWSSNPNLIFGYTSFSWE
jgi:hypothetical protein